MRNTARCFRFVLTPARVFSFFRSFLRQTSRSAYKVANMGCEMHVGFTGLPSRNSGNRSAAEGARGRVVGFWNGLELQESTWPLIGYLLATATRETLVFSAN